MNAYIESVIETVKKKHGSEPEFVQTVEEVLSSLDPVVSAHPEYEAVDLLGRMVEPERMFTFRVVWCDDNGQCGPTTPARPTPTSAIAASSMVLLAPIRAACASSPTCIPASSSSWALSRSSKTP